MKNPPLNFYPLMSRTDQSDWMVIHRFHAQETWKRTQGVFGKSLLFAKAILWPFLEIRRAFRKTKEFGENVRRATAISKRRQWIEQLCLAFAGGISPKSYYLFQLYLPDNRKRAQRYLHRYETKGEAYLYRVLSPDGAAARRLLNQKDKFRDYCEVNDLSTAPVHGVIAPENSISEAGGEHLPPLDLFIKPVKGRGGKNTQIWSYRGDGAYVSTEGSVLSREALLKQLRADAVEEPLLVQSRLENHADLKELCGGVFSTARIMTVLNEDLEPEVTTAVFRMANGSAIVDNIHRGGLAASIDLVSGTLGCAQGLSPDAMRVDVHPKSEVRIKGFKLPHWEAARDLAIRAHKALPDNALTLVGWDIGFAKDGPMLVEGNSGPCVHLLQRGLGAPLGDTRFGELVAFHLARIQAAGSQKP